VGTEKPALSEIDAAEQELDDALAILSRSAGQLVRDAVRMNGGVMVEHDSFDDLVCQLARCNKAAEAHILACAKKPQAQADADKCIMCDGTGKRRFPAFWPAETVGPSGDPDDLAVAYASGISRFGGFPRIGFVMRGDMIVVGIEVRDTRTGDTREATRVFDCQPMALPAPVASSVLAQMIQAAASRAKGPRR